MPARKREAPNFDPDQQRLEAAYSERLHANLILNNKTNSEFKDQNPLPSFQQEALPEATPIPVEQYKSELPFVNPHYAPTQPASTPTSSTQDFDYSTNFQQHSSTQFDQPERSVRSNQSNSISNQSAEIPVKSKRRIKPLELLLGALASGLLVRVAINIAASAFITPLYWLVVASVVGGCIALIYYSKNPKATRPYVVAAACFLLGFFLGGINL